MRLVVFFFQAEDGIRDSSVTGVQTCALPLLEPFEEQLDLPARLVEICDRACREVLDVGEELVFPPCLGTGVADETERAHAHRARPLASKRDTAAQRAALSSMQLALRGPPR